MGPEVGETICGRIRIDGELPSGFGSPCFGPPREATLVDTQERLWVTVIDGRFVSSAVDVSRFMAGANALTGLRHPTLVRVELVDREAEYCVVGVDALPNARPVSDLLARPVPPPLLERVAVETARSLASLHRAGQIHGVLGLGSVLLWEGMPMLWQYGLADHCDPSQIAATIQGGRRWIAAPEVASGRGIDPRSDIYAWGALVAQLVTGKPGAEAVAAVTGGSVGRDAHPHLMALVEAALRPDPELRPFDGVALLTELQGPSGGGSMRARAATEVPELARRYLKEFADAPPERSGPPPVGEADLETFDIDAVLNAPKIAAPGTVLHSDAGPREKGPVSPVAPTPLVGTYPPVDISRMELSSRTAVVPALSGRESFMPGAPPQADAPFGRAGLELDLSAARSSVSRPNMTFGGPGPVPPELPVVATPRRSGGLAAIGVVLVGTAGAIATMLYLARSSAPARSVPEADLAGIAAAADRSDAPQHAAPEESGASADGEGGEEEGEGSPARADRCPEDMAPLRREAGARTCIEIAEFPGLREIPRINVSLRQAESLCAERGRRLCGRSEWTLACAGLGDGRAFPYGGAHVQDRCNEATAAGVPQNLSRAGARERCVTPEGVFDLLGNVAEWVHEGVAMGGDATAVRPTCTTQRRLEAVTAEGALGFRCCVTLDSTRPAHAEGS